MSARFKPSEGDWICGDSKCGNVNFARRTECNKCGRANADGTVYKKGGMEIGKTLAEKSKGLFSADDWQCKGCGNVNWARRMNCNMCSTPKYGKNEARTGFGGGYMERVEVQYKEREDSDDEYDQFGRKKKKQRAPDSVDEKKASNDEPPNDADDDDDEEDESGDATKYNLDSDEDEGGDMSKYHLEDDDDDDEGDVSKYNLEDEDDESKDKDDESKDKDDESKDKNKSDGVTGDKSASDSSTSGSSSSSSSSRSSSPANVERKRNHSRSRSASPSVKKSRKSLGSSPSN